MGSETCRGPRAVTPQAEEGSHRPRYEGWEGRLPQARGRGHPSLITVPLYVRLTGVKLIDEVGGRGGRDKPVPTIPHTNSDVKKERKDIPGRESHCVPGREGTAESGEGRNAP